MCNIETAKISHITPQKRPFLAGIFVTPTKERALQTDEDKQPSNMVAILHIFMK
jgi:hypothetical protein